MIGPLLAIVCMWPGCLAAWVGGWESDLEASVRAAGDALRATRNLPWYDADRDALRRIAVRGDEDDQRRQSRWESDPESREAFEAPSPSLVWQMIQVLVWVALGALLAAIMWLLVWAAHRLDSRGLADDKSIASESVGPERLEGLPMALPSTDHDLLSAARACYEAGDYNLAIIYAYAHQLVKLDQYHAIQLRKGKTNRQYLRELHALPRLRALLCDTMLAFEEVFFGHHTLSRARFERCWGSLDEFHRQLEQLA